MTYQESVDFFRKYERAFIIGSPRSGTTWLQTMLGQMSGVVTHVELSLFHRYLSTLWSIWEDEKRVNDSGKWNIGQPTLWSEEKFFEWTSRFLAESYSSLQFSGESKIILDKHPGYTFHVNLIRRYFPNAKFIHVIRDPRSVAKSLVRINKQMGAGFGSSNWINAVSTWNEFVKEAQKWETDKTHYKVRYEDLTNSPIKELSGIAEFLGIELSESCIGEIVEGSSFERMREGRIAQSAKFKINRQHYGGETRELLTTEKILLNKIAGDTMLALGYVSDSEWWYDSSMEKILGLIQHYTNTIQNILR